MKSSWPVRMIVGFARFWWDFLVGDTPELFLAAVVILSVVAIIRVGAHENALAVAVLPLLAVAALGVSLARARRR
jgi:hypothetical protein